MAGVSNGPVRPATVVELRALLGVELGPTDWYEIKQSSVNVFADVTEDRQWIHVDPERAVHGPFGGTIAHGLYTLGLEAMLMNELIAFDGFAHTLNYGYDKVRFPAPLRVGARIRMRSTISDVKDVEGGAQVTIVHKFEAEDEPKPVCVAESLGRFIERR